MPRALSIFLLLAPLIAACASNEAYERGAKKAARDIDGSTVDEWLAKQRREWDDLIVDKTRPATENVIPAARSRSASRSPFTPSWPKKSCSRIDLLCFLATSLRASRYLSCGETPWSRRSLLTSW